MLKWTRECMTGCQRIDLKKIKNVMIFFSMKWCSRTQKFIYHKCVKYNCSMEKVQQKGVFFSFFLLNSTHILIYSLCNSVSGDGRVSNWTIVKTALWYNDTLLINFSKPLHNLGEDSITTQLMGQYREGVQGRHEPHKMVSKPLDSPISI